MNRLTAIMAAIVLAAGGAVAGERAEPTQPEEQVKGQKTFEVESFTLTKGVVETMKGAGGGKVVLLTHEESQATKSVALKKGTYELIVYGYAPSFDEDGFFVHVGDQLDRRMVIPNIKKLLPTKPLRFNVTKDGPCEVTIALGEEHVRFDRVVIRPFRLVVEVETFKLKGAKVVALDGAGGGKAVVLGDEDSQAQGTVPMLKKGSYELVVHGLAPSYDEDAFFVTAGDQIDVRLFITDIEKLLPSSPLKFTQEKDGPCTIVISHGEDNVKLDRVVIGPVMK